MYTGLLHSHNGFRWLVLIAIFMAILFAVNGWSKKSNWGRADNTLGLLLVIFMDIQVILGIILYAFVSPLTQSAFTDFGAAMKNAVLRFYAVEHLLMMLIALVLIHIGRIKSKKATIGWKSHRSAAIFYTIALLIILAAIPWDRALF